MIVNHKGLNAKLFLVLFASALLSTVGCSADEDDLSYADCSSYNVYDGSCEEISKLDSAAYVAHYIGSWYLAATQASGFRTGSTECFTHSQTNSPAQFEFRADGTFRYQSFSAEPSDTTASWKAIRRPSGNWQILSDLRSLPLPTPAFDCGGRLVDDDRPVDGSLTVWARR